MAPSTKTFATALICTSVAAFQGTNAFSSSSPQTTRSNNVKLNSSASSDDLPKMSEAIPFLQRPPVLKKTYPGDVGFDPLRLATNADDLMEKREAEIKHARLAMLAAVGWPLSELLDDKIAMKFNVQSALDFTGRVPSLLNGGLEKISPIWWGFCLGLTAAIDIYGVKRARAAGEDSDYHPGNLGFDPLGLYPDDKQGQQRMQLAEIKHGRVAMLAVTWYALEEALTSKGVVEDTPFLFSPVSDSLSKLF